MVGGGPIAQALLPLTRLRLVGQSIDRPGSRNVQF